MSDKRGTESEAGLREYLKGEVSRAQMLKAAGFGLALAVVPGATQADSDPGTGRLEFPFFPHVAGTYQTEALQDILNVLLTFEHLAVTFYVGAVAAAQKLALNPLANTVLQAILAQEQYHADFLTSIGATSLTDTFTLPSSVYASPVAILKTAELGETVGVGAYMTALREFAELGQPTLAKYAYQLGATEAEHRVLARARLALGGDAASLPPNNKPFETDLFLYVKDAYALLKQLGFIGGTGTATAYPGRDAALAAAGSMAGALTQKTPNNASTSVGPADNLTAPRS